ncbi:cuticular protein 47Eg [Drosophila mojavensis]|uniref:cuticular protein 47Eg n=1 Tax=Drosophila mojavensis TaxID=7230 RepID=UPI00017C9375|nr:cuticular protein 47Eg [Drosophila mojavensis]
MKFFIAFACLLAVACAYENVDVITDARNLDIDSFQTEYKLSNTIESQQSGKLNGENWVVSGQNSYVSPEGENVFIQYVADENGYNVVKANPPLPTPPAIPEAIQRAIEYIRAHPIPENQN